MTEEIEKAKPTTKKVAAPPAAATVTDQIVAIITKQPPHGFSVTLNEGGQKKTYQFNSKEAMCVFLGMSRL